MAPVDYPWSSHNHNALGVDQALIKPHAAYLALGDTKDSRCESYRTLVAERSPPEELAEIRLHTQQQRVYGSTKLQRQIEALTNRDAAVRPRDGREDGRALSYRLKNEPDPFWFLFGYAPTRRTARSRS